MLISLVFDKSVTDRPTNQRTDGRTDGRTDPLKEMWVFRENMNDFLSTSKTLRDIGSETHIGRTDGRTDGRTYRLTRSTRHKLV